MLSLTREVRFTIPLGDARPGQSQPVNGLAGNLIDGAGVFCRLQLTLSGRLDPLSSYIENVKRIDAEIRGHVLEPLAGLVRSGRFTLARAVGAAMAALDEQWRSGQIERLRLATNPYLWCEMSCREKNMIRLTQRFEFSAAHRLHNPAIGEQENQRLFGKCNNPAGHGHNYVLEVTLKGPVNADGRLIAPEAFAEIVQQAVIEPFDHKHLNQQTEAFADTIPSVENIARVVFEMLKLRFAAPVTLQSVRVWETGKTFAEYDDA